MEESIKILYVCPVGERGGVETIQLNIIKGLSRTRYVPVIVVLQDGPFVRELRDTGASVYLVKSGKIRNIFKTIIAIRRIVKIIRTENIKIVHSHNAKAHILGSIAAKLCNIPCIYHLHGIPRISFSRDGFVSFLSVKIGADKMIAVSKYVRDEFKNIWKGNYDVEVIYNGIALNESKIDKIKARKKLGLLGDLFIITFIGRLQKWKGVDVFINSAARVIEKIENVKFIIVGGTLFGRETKYRKELERLRNSYNLGDKLIFAGFQNDILNYYSASDIIIIPSIKGDPLPTVVLESMLFGLPVVASKIGGIPEMVDDGKTGYLFTPGNVDELTDCLLRLLNLPDQMKQMGIEGRKKMEKMFTVESMINKLSDVYNQLLEQSLR